MGGVVLWLCVVGAFAGLNSGPFQAEMQQRVKVKCCEIKSSSVTSRTRGAATTKEEEGKGYCRSKRTSPVRTGAGGSACDDLGPGGMPPLTRMGFPGWQMGILKGAAKKSPLSDSSSSRYCFAGAVLAVVVVVEGRAGLWSRGRGYSRKLGCYQLIAATLLCGAVS